MDHGYEPIAASDFAGRNDCVGLYNPMHRTTARPPRTKSGGPASSPASYYVTREQLAELVRAAHATGRACDQLGKALAQIAGGMWDRYHYTRSREDFVQDAVLHLLQTPLRRADPSKNCFGWFSTCTAWYAWKLRTKERTGDQRERELRAAYISAVLADRRRADGPPEATELDDAIFDIEPDPEMC